MGIVLGKGHKTRTSSLQEEIKKQSLWNRKSIYPLNMQFQRIMFLLFIPFFNFDHYFHFLLIAPNVKDYCFTFSQCQDMMVQLTFLKFRFKFFSVQCFLIKVIYDL